jgi:hypothetical protein
VVLAEDETHVNLLPWVRATWIPHGSATFTTFCEQLLAAYPTAPVVAAICDNVIIHRSKIVQRWLGKHPRQAA